MHAAIYGSFCHAVTNPYIGRIHNTSAKTAHKGISGYGSLAVTGADLAFCRAHALSENSADRSARISGSCHINSCGAVLHKVLPLAGSKLADNAGCPGLARSCIFNAALHLDAADRCPIADTNSNGRTFI